MLLLVGDFNARGACSSVRSSDVPAWYGVRGFHGAERMNEAGKYCCPSAH